MRSTLISYVLEYIYLERNSLFLSASVNYNNDKEKVGEIYPTDPGKNQNHELQKITLLGTSHILRKGLYTQQDFYLFLTPVPTNGLGYYVVLWHKVKGNSNNNNNTIHLKFTLSYLSESCVEFRAIFSQAVKKARLTVKP